MGSSFNSTTNYVHLRIMYIAPTSKSGEQNPLARKRHCAKSGGKPRKIWGASDA